jgi:hypothetical protein
LGSNVKAHGLIMAPKEARKETRRRVEKGQFPGQGSPRRVKGPF